MTVTNEIDHGAQERVLPPGVVLIKGIVLSMFYEPVLIFDSLGDQSDRGLSELLDILLERITSREP